jgi:hypothetical protein
MDVKKLKQGAVLAVQYVDDRWYNVRLERRLRDSRIETDIWRIRYIVDDAHSRIAFHADGFVPHPRAPGVRTFAQSPLWYQWSDAIVEAVEAAVEAVEAVETVETVEAVEASSSAASASDTAGGRAALGASAEADADADADAYEAAVGMMMLDASRDTETAQTAQTAQTALRVLRDLVPRRRPRAGECGHLTKRRCGSVVVLSVHE